MNERNMALSTVTVSIVIVNRNTRELLRECLTSVRDDRSVPGREVIVVDNGSTDGSVEMLREEFAEVRTILNSGNEGFAKPNNDGMRIAGGRYLFLLNSDARIENGTLGALVGFLETHPGAGACGPRLIYPDGRLQRSVSLPHSFRTHIFDMLFLDAIFPWSRFFAGGEMTRYRYDPDREQTVPCLMGAAFVIRREVMTKTGVFDEHLSIYYNEMDWFMRMAVDGWTVHYVPSTTVVHHRGATAARVNSGFSKFNEMYANVFHFFRKHYGPAAPHLYRLLLIAGFVPRWCLWAVRAWLTPSDFARHMRTYSWKVLLLGVRWWKGTDAGS
jgi:GT2 family glycosyltransferase